MKSELAAFSNRLDFLVRFCFYQLGWLIARYPIFFLVLPLLFFAVFSAGLLLLKEQSIIPLREQLAAAGTPSQYESKVSREFFGAKKPFWVFVAIGAKDGGSVLRPNHLSHLRKMKSFLNSGLTISYRNSSFVFADLCDRHCSANRPADIFLRSYNNQSFFGHLTNVRPTYPAMSFFSHSVYLGNNLYGVEIDEKTRIVTSVKVVVFNFYSTVDSEEKGLLLELWERAVFDFVSTFAHPLLNLTASGEWIQNKETHMMAQAPKPYLPFAFGLIFIFTVLSSLRADLVTAKPWEAVAAVICPGLAIATSFGLLLLLNVRFQQMVSVTPFLIIGIGVDDAFLVLHAWHRTDPRLSPEERLALTLQEAGPSISITSLTNTLSFAAGSWTHTEFVRVFCIYTSVAIAVDYFFQIALFSAVLLLGGRREHARKNAFFPWRKVKDSSVQKPLRRNYMNRAKTQIYSFMLSRPALIIVGVLLIVYWAVAAWGVAIFKIELADNRPFIEGGVQNQAAKLRNYFIYGEGAVLYLFINNPGNLREKNRRRRLENLVDRIESIEQSVGKVSTKFWLRDYIDFLEYFKKMEPDRNDEFRFDMMDVFFSLSSNKNWKLYLQFNESECKRNQPSCVSRFFLSTGYHRASNWGVRYEFIQRARQICSEFPEFNATIFEYISFYIDIYGVVGSSTLQSAGSALGFVLLVCCFFIPSPFSIFVAALSVLSINLGVVGFLAHWGVDLDLVSMPCIIMSIGFSIDFTSHISYHYHRNSGSGREERLREALDAVAWPTFQGGLSTILGTAVVALVPSYLTRVFFKTVFLVISFGLFHGLIVLPVLLSYLPTKKTNELQ